MNEKLLTPGETISSTSIKIKQYLVDRIEINRRLLENMGDIQKICKVQGAILELRKLLDQINESDPATRANGD